MANIKEIKGTEGVSHQHSTETECVSNSSSDSQNNKLCNKTYTMKTHFQKLSNKLYALSCLELVDLTDL